MRIGGIRLGVLDLYRDETGMLSDAELADALLFADAATSILLHLQAEATPPATRRDWTRGARNDDG